MKSSLVNSSTLILKLQCPVIVLIFCLFFGGILSGCDKILTKDVEAQSPSQNRNQPLSVEVTTAKIQSLTQGVNYVGNTQPEREVSLRSQTEGRLLSLNVDVGDRVTNGQLIAQLDDTLLQTAISEADAQLAVLKSEVINSQNEVSNAQVQVKEAQVQLKQTQADAKRYQDLASQGAVSLQQAEVAQTNAEVASQRLLSAQEQVRIRQEGVIASQQRVKAQNSALAQVKERRSYSLLTAPIAGIVLEKITEPGNLVQPGGEVIKIGDFSRVKVVVPISELKLEDIRVGQSVTVTIDAFADQSFNGTISRISPASNAQTRQIPIEVSIPNSDGRIGSGLLARVKLGENNQGIMVPESALQGENQDTIFVIKNSGDQKIVEARKIQQGDRRNNLVEISSGLSEGERFVVRSSRPLKEGEIVQLSVLSQ